MSLHISAKPGEIAPVVLMPGDPLRAKFIADHFLTDVVQVSNTRSAFYFTGTYKGKRVTAGASGMGCPSIGIYSFELYREYNVDCIIRIGTCGAYSTELNLYDLLNVEMAFSESTYAKYAFGYQPDHMPHQGRAFAAIHLASANLNMKVKTASIHSSDIFYRADPAIPTIAAANHCLAVEMEAFALFANARHLGKTAATLLTVSDIIPTHQKISPEERERSLLPMMELALESTLLL
jgi:purine-nucleoside phosphorylase